MGASYDETVMEAEEKGGITRGGARFQQEKRQRIGKSPVAIKTQDH